MLKLHAVLCSPAGCRAQADASVCSQKRGRGSIFVALGVLVFVACLMAGLLAISQPSDAYAANKTHVVDKAQIFSETEEQQLSARIDQYIEKHNMDILIFTDTTTNNKQVRQYAADYYTSNGYGTNDDKNGLVFFICMEPNNHCWYTAATGSCSELITEKNLNKVDDAIEPYMKKSAFYDAANVYIDKMDVLYTNGCFPIEASDYAIAAGVALAAGALVGFLWLRSRKKKMQTIAVATEASRYAVTRFVCRSQRDEFVGNTVAYIQLHDNDKHGDGHGGSLNFGSFSSGGSSFRGGGRSF